MYVLGAGTAHDHAASIAEMPDLTTTPGAISGANAFRMAGITPADVDVLEGYDSFTITALLHLEDLGFCKKGEGGAFAEEGHTGPGGSLPMNTNGGGLSYTHPGMYGMFLLTEATKQLRGECGERQVDGRGDRGRARRRLHPLLHVDDCPGNRGDAVSDRPARFEPQPTEASTPYWEATRDQRLVLQWCLDCEQPVHYPRVACPACLGDRLEFRPASGDGVVHAVVVEHRPPSPFGDDQPYTVALVDLDEGVRMITNVVGCRARTRWRWAWRSA